MIEVYDKILSGVTFIDLFAGVGGFRLALESLGARCVFSSEWDAAAARTYAENFGDVPAGDVTKINEKDVPDHDVLCAGFPCQAFSISGKKLGFEDSRGTLFFDVARIAKEKKPKIVFLENVKNFASHDGGNTLRVVRETMEGLGYDFFYKVLNASDYGVPQKRERIYMVCVRRNLASESFSFPKPIPLERHVKDVLLPDGEDVAPLWKSTDGVVFKSGVSNAPSNSPVRVGSVGLGRQGERVYGVNGTAVTLSAYGGGTFAKTGGYLIDGRVRRLHPRECARLMGYPDSYKIAESPNTAYKQFGNSVVVDVLQRIALEFGKFLK